jgi:hypothetical protein
LPANGHSGLERTDENRRIHPRIIQADVPVHVRPGRAPGRAHSADHLATAQLLAGFTSIFDMWQNMLMKPWPWSTNTVRH